MRYQYGISGVRGPLRANCRDGRSPCAECFWNEDLMIVPMARITFAAFALLMASRPAIVHAQDVPGIEICTVEKTMERRTSCLQSNVDFLQKSFPASRSAPWKKPWSGAHLVCKARSTSCRR